MAYDEDVAQRFRDSLIGLPDVSEVKMMGGICWLLSGNMIGGTFTDKVRSAFFMLRVGKENMPEALCRPGASVMMNGSRPMTGFIQLEAAGCSDTALSEWVSLCVSFVGSLPPKAKDQSSA